MCFRITLKQNVKTEHYLLVIITDGLKIYLPYLYSDFNKPSLINVGEIEDHIPSSGNDFSLQPALRQATCLCWQRSGWLKLHRGCVLFNKISNSLLVIVPTESLSRNSLFIMNHFWPWRQ